MKVPFVDLHTQYLTIKSEIDAAIENVIRETSFIRGPYVKGFEQDFKQRFGVAACVGVANGTDALYIVMKMLGIGEGDEVITVANSWISTSETISQTGARPVFVDVEEDYYTIDVSQIEAAITPRTKAVLPVHLLGQAADIRKIKEICDRRGLYLIEDCAQSHFSEFEGQLVGTFGHASTFSFYPGKNLGAFGDAGCILSDDEVLAEKCRMYANHGSLVKHQHVMEGINSRLDGLQAAILQAKLPYLAKWNELRRTHAAEYDRLLSEVGEVVTPKVRPNTVHTFHVYQIRAQDRDALRQFLDSKGIETFLHYPSPLPFLPAYQYLGHNRQDFPVAAKYQDQILSLPIFPEMEKEMIGYVADCIKAFYRKTA